MARKSRGVAVSVRAWRACAPANASPWSVAVAIPRPVVRAWRAEPTLPWRLGGGGEGKRADRTATGAPLDTTYPSASGGLRDAYDQVTHPEERGHPCGEAVHDDDRGWMVKSGEIGGFVGGSLKHPRQRLGAQ